MLSSYRIQCIWKPDKDPTAKRGSLQRGQIRMPGSVGGGSGSGFGSAGLRRDGGEGGGGLGGIGAKAREEGYRVIAGLTLYKVRILRANECGVIFMRIFFLWSFVDL